MPFEINQESGFPSSYDFYSNGSEETVKGMIHTPEGMNSVQHSAALNPHHEHSDTKHIGVPGTTYTPSREDVVWRSEGGHAIVWGNAAGSETLRIQSRHGATVELDSEGSIKMVSVKGMHVAIGGDNQIVLTGDFTIATNGDFKVKCGSVHFDCHDFNVNASGNMITSVHGTHNSSVYGDSHSTVQGDHSSTVGGDNRQTTAGSLTNNVAGDMTYSGKATATFSSKGDMSVGSKAKMSHTAEGDMSVKTNGKMDHAAIGDMSQSSNGNYSQNAKGTMAVQSTGNLTTSSKATTTVSGGGAMKLATNGAMDVKASSLNGITDSDGASSVNANGNASHADPAAVDNQQAKVEIKVPEEKMILDEVGDMAATDNGIDKIFTMSQLESQYGTDDGGTIPPKVLERAKKMGIGGADYKASEAISTSATYASYGSGLTFGV